MTRPVGCSSGLNAASFEGEEGNPISLRGRSFPTVPAGPLGCRDRTLPARREEFPGPAWPPRVAPVAPLAGVLNFRFRDPVRPTAGGAGGPARSVLRAGEMPYHCLMSCTPYTKLQSGR